MWPTLVLVGEFEMEETNVSQTLPISLAAFPGPLAGSSFFVQGSASLLKEKIHKKKPIKFLLYT
jgi:hypothetical protein